jgi:opacity protein-like surface antigen
LRAAIAVVGIGAMFGAAFAAPAAPDWSGVFVGAEGGFSWANRSGCWNFGAPAAPDCATVLNSHLFSYSQSGWLGGFQAGYNWRLPSNLVFGVQGAFDIANITGTIPSGSSAGVGTWNALGLATAKLGWTNGPLLLYGDAGLAYGNLDFVGNLGCNFNMSHTGPAAGAGVGWKVSEKLSLNVEYDHAWFDTLSARCTGAHTNVEVKTGGGLDMVKFGLAYQLGQ